MTLSMTLLIQEGKPVLHVTCLRHTTLIVSAEALQNFVHGINFLLWITLKNSKIFAYFPMENSLKVKSKQAPLGQTLKIYELSPFCNFWCRKSRTKPLNL